MTAAWKSWRRPSEGEVIDLFDWQDDRCAWCGYSNGDRRLVRDHCHFTGLVRGYLCSGCNSQEGWADDSVWGAWRSGDNPAHALGHWEIYRNHMGVTPISPQGALNYYSHHERLAWFALIPQALSDGAPWPEDAPWIDTAVARREAGHEQVRAALDDIFGGKFSAPGEAAS